MKHFDISKHRSDFKVLASTRAAQAAVMLLEPGDTTGEPSNEHPRSEQWLYVISGTGKALVGRRRTALRKGSLLLIEKGEVHQVANTGRTPLLTLNFYAPPAYTRSSELR